LNFTKTILFLSNKAFPIIGFPILLWLWYQKEGTAFAILVMGLPFVFGYVVPGIGTNVLKMWRFRDRWVIGNYFIHHGFIYASTMGLVMLLAFFPPSGNEALPFLGNMARAAVLLGRDNP